MPMIILPTKNELENYRSIGDAGFSQAVSKFNHQDLSVFWTLKDNQALLELLEKPKFQSLANYAGQLPIWVNYEQLNQSEDFFQEKMFDLMMMLGLVSLPYCYGGADGAKVLIQSKRITENIEQRLMETGGFVLDVCSPQAFEGHGKGFLACIKVRFIHEFIRQKLLTKEQWNSTVHGFPVNQLDQAGTNLSFSLIAIRAIRNIGINISDKKANSYLHRWNVISSLIGLSDQLIAPDMKTASQLASVIEKYQFRASEEGSILTNSLLAFMRKQEGIEKISSILPIYMAFLLGPKIANYIGLRHDSRNFIFEFNGVYNQMKEFASWLPGQQSLISSNGKEASKQMSKLPFLID